MTIIAPSILSADFAKLGEDVREAERCGADWIHIDIMDGQFVPNLTFGPPVVGAIRSYTSLPFDVHLMVNTPERLFEDLKKAGADRITVHAEACLHLHRTIHAIRELGLKAGVALNPHTPLSVLDHILEDIDLALIMTVNPGFGGQSFIPAMLPKIRDLRGRLDAKGLHGVHIEVDGGINGETAALVAQAGANALVAGNYIYGNNDRASAISTLKNSAKA
ncbi:ribulose-phosphate 3-epimerase [Cohnella thailandensis]|uniref:Ribulose-phosphate 3-epimerase n=1 Tax=Cohnella thailandensis TaxID=557557 RepID=A0A841T3E3_9BACL|nr:ribulose-phosphate 3-epimerase [Cohnella thailandensis]MBB6636570.1 ribulose-phosphate 3-epimerase [Cohnella thailandensis]MBP1973556.1 ribulose-phosphate 3-epimerase [Cohnella thailandensis]